MTGHPEPRRTSARPSLLLSRQKRIPLFPLVLLLAVALLAAAGLVAAGCGSEATSTTAAPITTTSAPAETTTTAAAETTTSVAAAPAEGTFPVTITDDTGNEVIVKTKPVHIVSTAPASTEILFAIGAGDRVVGVNTLDDYPPEVANIAKIGDFQLNTEAIMALSPDLVLAYSGLGAEEALDPVKAAGAPVLMFDAKSIEGVYADILMVGEATGNTGQAAAVVESLKAQIKQISDQAVAAGSAPKVFYAVDSTLWTVGTGTFVDDLLKLANAVNVGSMAGASAATQGYYQFAPEQLIAADPDVILLPNTAFPNGIDDFVKDPRFAELRAVKEGRVLLINDTIITRPGPRIAEGLQTLLEAVHPQAQ